MNERQQKARLNLFDIVVMISVLAIFFLTLYISAIVNFGIANDGTPLKLILQTTEFSEKFDNPIKAGDTVYGESGSVIGTVISVSYASYTDQPEMTGESSKADIRNGSMTALLELECSGSAENSGGTLGSVSLHGKKYMMGERYSFKTGEFFFDAVITGWEEIKG